MNSLPELEESSTLLADLDPNPLAVLGHDRRALYGNPAAWELAGVQDNVQFQGRRIGEVLHCIHSLEPEGCGETASCQYCGANRSIRSSLEGAPNTDECRITAYTPNGNAGLEFAVQSRPVIWKGQKAVFCALKDISHEKRRRILERTFFEDIVRAAGSAQGISEMLLTEQRDRNGEEHAELLRQMRDTCGTMLTEIRNQQTLLAAETDHLQVAWKRVAIGDCIETAVAMASCLTAANGKNIFPAPPPAKTMFWTDPELLGLVLMNLLKNALEASMPGQEVRLRGLVVGDKVQFSVWNKGLMTKEARMQMFQRSFSTKGAGRGLGTYSLRLLAESFLGGEVSFTSSESAGTNFVVSLPVKPKTGPRPDCTLEA